MKDYMDNVGTPPVEYSNFRTIQFHPFMNHPKYLAKCFSKINVQISARNQFSCSVMFECFCHHLKLLIHTCPNWGNTCQTVYYRKKKNNNYPYAAIQKVFYSYITLTVFYEFFLSCCCTIYVQFELKPLHVFPFF